MNLENMLDRVVVVDNIEDEAQALTNQLMKHDISVDEYVIGDDYNVLPIFTKNRQLIFMDLMLDEDASHTPTNISRIIQILNHIIGNGFGPYGLIIWTKHTNRYEELLTRFTKAVSISNQGQQQDISSEDEISVDVQLNNPPLFTMAIDKTQFKSTGVWDFSNLMQILNQKLQESTAAYFFLRWLSVARQASQDTISDIYKLTSNYQSKEADIKHILYKLAINHTGIDHQYPGLTADTYKAFSDIIHPRIHALTSSEKKPLFSQVDEAYKSDNEDIILAQLNSILFFDGIGINQDEVVPGNIYQVMDSNSLLIVKSEDRIKLQKKKLNSEKLEGYKDYDCINVAIELTPPCDFSNKKIISRLVGGYIVEYNANEGNKKLQKSEKNYILPPITLPGDSTIRYVIFDFRYLMTPTDEQLRDSTQFKVLFRATHSLFSDILQKFSSHAARLGLKGLEPW